MVVESGESLDEEDPEAGGAEAVDAKAKGR